MKNFKHLFIFILAGLIVPSCIDDSAPEDAFGQGANLVSFNSGTANASIIASGRDVTYNVPMIVKGPSARRISGPVTATIAVDPSSTAVEGVHYRLDDATIELSPDNDLLALFPVTVITAGIEPPLEETPVLVLNVTTASGENVIANGKKVSINLLYLCESILDATYDVTLEYWRGGTLQSTVNYTDVITKTGDGEYRTGRVGHWTVEDLGGTPGFTFLDVCDAITIPEQNLVDLYSNLVTGVEGKSTVDPVTGDIYMEYTVCATDCREYFVNYVRQ